MSPSTTEVPRVLVAEDDFELRKLLCASLRRAGFEVLEARDGLQLGELLEAHQARGGRAAGFDLVITDVRMPGRSGLLALAELRRHDWITPVVVITAFGDEATHAEAHRLGANAVLDKPFSMAALRALATDLTDGPAGLA
jgi:DNA-binding response OmpR family regulator